MMTEPDEFITSLAVILQGLLERYTTNIEWLVVPLQEHWDCQLSVTGTTNVGGIGYVSHTSSGTYLIDRLIRDLSAPDADRAQICYFFYLHIFSVAVRRHLDVIFGQRSFVFADFEAIIRQNDLPD